jgi:NADH-quinone oxidoreductase subunit G
VGTATIEDIDTADMILLVGTNPRAEAPVLNARIRKAWLAGAEIGLVGEAVDLTYEYAHAGDGPAALKAMADKGVSDETKAKNTLVIVGQSALQREDGLAILAEAQRMAETSGSGLMILHTAASRVGGMDIGFTTEGGVTAALDGADVVWALGVDEGDIPAGSTVIYQGSHGDRGAHRADIILPAACYTEEAGTFVNTEGRVQQALRANFPPGDAKENWAILRAASAHLGATLPYDSLSALRAALYEAHPHLAEIDAVQANEGEALAPGELADQPFGQALANFYFTNPIARASVVLADAARVAMGETQIAAE